MLELLYGQADVISLTAEPNELLKALQMLTDNIESRAQLGSAALRRSARVHIDRIVVAYEEVCGITCAKGRSGQT